MFNELMIMKLNSTHLYHKTIFASRLGNKESFCSLIRQHILGHMSPEAGLALS